MAKIAIIGGGFSGISAAHYLSKNGNEVSIFEKQSFLGGRWHQTKDIDFDNGQHLLSAAYKETLNLLTELNCRQLFQSTGVLKIDFCDKNMHFPFDTGIYPGKLGQLIGIMKLPGLNKKSKFAIINFILKISKNKIEAKNSSALHLLINNNQSGEAVKRFWIPIIIATLNSPPAKVSAELFITVLQKAFFGKKADTALIYPTKPISEIIDVIENELSKRVAIHKSTIIESIHDNGYSIELKTNNDQILKFDRVISTLPYNDFTKLFPDIAKTLGDFNTIDFSPIISLSMIYDREITPNVITAMLDSSSEWIFNKNKMYGIESKADSKKNTFRYDITISSADTLIYKTNQKIIKTVNKEIKGHFYKEKAQLLDSKIYKEKLATPIFTPKIQALRPEIINHGNITITGDWIQNHYPATIEGAVINGKKVSDI